MRGIKDTRYRNDKDLVDKRLSPIYSHRSTRGKLAAYESTVEGCFFCFTNICNRVELEKHNIKKCELQEFYSRGHSKHEDSIFMQLGLKALLTSLKL